jgi:hypothetical protein
MPIDDLVYVHVCLRVSASMLESLLGLDFKDRAVIATAQFKGWEG